MGESGVARGERGVRDAKGVACFVYCLLCVWMMTKMLTGPVSDDGACQHFVTPN